MQFPGRFASNSHISHGNVSNPWEGSATLISVRRMINNGVRGEVGQIFRQCLLPPKIDPDFDLMANKSRGKWFTVEFSMTCRDEN